MPHLTAKGLCKVYYSYIKSAMTAKTEKDIPSLDGKDWLSQEFTRRCRRNPKYSIRAFAQLLKMNSSSVSQMLSGKRSPSLKMIENLSKILGASPEIQEQLYRFIKNKKNGTKETENNYTQISLDAYTLIADWYHYAILEMTFIEGFKSDAKWISKKLGITTTEARIAIDRLKRLNLLDERDGILIKTENFLTNFSNGVTSNALKNLQRKVLEMGLDAIDNTPAEEKDITSMTFAIVPEKLPAAKNKIKEFRRTLSEFLETGKQNRVYHLGIQLYPISKK